MPKLAQFLGKTESWLRYGDPVEPAVKELTQAYEGGRGRVYPLVVREYLAELRLRLVRAGATDEQVEEAFDLFKSPEVFSFFSGGMTQPFSESDILNNVQKLAEEAVIPTLKRRGLKL